MYKFSRQPPGHCRNIPSDLNIFMQAFRRFGNFAYVCALTALLAARAVAGDEPSTAHVSTAPKTGSGETSKTATNRAETAESLAASVPRMDVFLRSADATPQIDQKYYDGNWSGWIG